MSVSSARSSMSVSYCGSEVALEEALDDVFQKLQQHLNDAHCAVRSMSMLEEQSMDEDEDFKEATKYDDTIQDDDCLIQRFEEHQQTGFREATQSGYENVVCKSSGCPKTRSTA